jgi:DNA-binding transcriptional LysR family regulator
MFDWDDLRIFLAVARSRHLASAARSLGMDATTVGRRLRRLGAALQSELFEVEAGERRLTEQGQALLAHAETIESTALHALGEVGGGSTQASGHVRLSVAEGVATWVLAPRLPAFRKRHPDIRLDLVTASGFLNPSKREADIAVMMARPRHGRLIAAKLADYRLRLYAAASYIETHGPIGSIEELSRHTLIGYVPEFLYSPELDYLGEVAPGLDANLRSTSINVQYSAIANGTGIGVLPSFIADQDPGLTMLFPEQVDIVRSFWLVTHSDMRRLARIEAVLEWLKEAPTGSLRPSIFAPGRTS